MAISNSDFAKTLGMPPEWAAKAAAFADAKGLSLAAREVVATFKDAWVGQDGRRRDPSLMLVVSADALMALALRERNFAPICTEFTEDGREWTDVWINGTPPAACRVTFEVEGITQPVRIVHTLAEYTQGTLTPTQRKMPALMLAKATRSLGVRQIAPTATGGLMTEEEAHAVDAATDAEVEHVAEVVDAVTPTQDVESKGTKMTRSEQYAARKAELVAVGKALRADCGDDAAGVLATAIKELGCNPEALTAANLKALLAVAKQARADHDAKAATTGDAIAPEAAAAMDAATDARTRADAAAPNTASQGSHAEAQAAWAQIGAQGDENASAGDTPADEFVI